MQWLLQTLETTGDPIDRHRNEVHNNVQDCRLRIILIRSEKGMLQFDNVRMILELLHDRQLTILVLFVLFLLLHCDDLSSFGHSAHIDFSECASSHQPFFPEGPAFLRLFLLLTTNARLGRFHCLNT